MWQQPWAAPLLHPAQLTDFSGKGARVWTPLSGDRPPNDPTREERRRAHGSNHRRRKAVGKGTQASVIGFPSKTSREFVHVLSIMKFGFFEMADSSFYLVQFAFQFVYFFRSLLLKSIRIFDHPGGWCVKRRVPSPILRHQCFDFSSSSSCSSQSTHSSIFCFVE